MTESENPKSKQGKRVPYEENVPSSRILKLALVAAAIILALGIVLYLKARHEPPALQDELRTAPAKYEARISLPGGGAAVQKRLEEHRLWAAQRS